MTEHNKLLDLTAKQIEELTAESFAELLHRIRNGEEAQQAIQAIMTGFEPAYRERLAVAFTETLGRFVQSSELKDYPIGETTLSRRLYQHADQTGMVVREIVRRHAAGFHDARQLAMQIYEGYGFKTRAGLPDDPLQWPRQSPKWPKYMRDAINADPASFNTYLGIARRAVDKVKTPGYQASLNEALDALQKGRGEKVLARKLEVAYQERMRYHANRIAQTELHRAHMDKQAEEIMADDTIQAVKVVMSSTHPRTDICDMWSKQDKYGLGPGIYPKEKAPRPPFHPFCRCVLHSKRLIQTDKARENPASERQYLARVMREEGASKAAQIIGGRAKLATALTNAPIDSIVNIHRPAPYRLGRVGDNAGVKNTEMVQSDLNSEAFERFFFNEPGAVSRFQVAALSESETRMFGVESPAMWLSRTTLDEHRKKHPDVGIEDYRRIPEIISQGRVWGGHKLKRYVLLHSDEKAYRAAIKADANGAESWFLSLVISTKQKPPKGAVLLR